MTNAVSQMSSNEQITVIKRDGKKVPFDSEKIVTAVKKAEVAVGKGISEGLAEDIAVSITNSVAESYKPVSVEDIQDMAENKLMASRRKDVAKAYMFYRAERTRIRQGQSYENLRSIVRVESNDITKENANMNAETPAGMMMKFASETARTFTSAELLKPEVNYLHQSGAIHIHDLDYYPTRSLTCVHHPLDIVLKHGFDVNHASHCPANSIHGAAVMAAISLETVQNEMHGGQSIPAFDFYLAPYVRVTYKKELKKVCEFTGLSLEKCQAVQITAYEKAPLEGLSDMYRAVQHAVNRTVDAVYQRDSFTT